MRSGHRVATVARVRRAGDLIASGRDADIFECGPGLVLRRSRNGRSLATEARTMEFVRAHGYPVPAVEEISDDGADLVMERIDGVSMVDAISRRPWQVRRHGAVLGDLHRRLHELPAPDWLDAVAVGAGDRLLHLDLHPLNVMVTSTGPVVIDWTNARRGDPAVDVALTWLLVSAGEVPSGRAMGTLLSAGRGLLVASFLRQVDRDAARHLLADVCAFKAHDPNMSERELAAMRALVQAEDPTTR
ncbi:MAG: hypothetical protein JWM05_2919 [Acidimicrobiales bacterium]|nr:hypothetical protein [Acidimicrobiales bacterium]